jgi:hypothetical protein
MAEAFQVLGIVPTVELVGQSSTRNVKLITARAEPSGAVFTWVQDPRDFTPANVELIGSGIAEAINAWANLPGVVDVTMYQDVAQSGQLVTYVAATVESASGNSTEDVRLATPAGLAAPFKALVAKTRAHLDAIEAV